MFISEGYVCASELSGSLKVTNARAVGNLCLIVTFNSGEERLLDATELLEFEAFAPLADPDTLAAFTIEHGVLTWCDGAIDIAPEGLYARTHEYPGKVVAA